jgi:hypothetical protein
MTDQVILERANGTAVITLNRPNARNALFERHSVVGLSWKAALNAVHVSRISAENAGG